MIDFERLDRKPGERDEEAWYVRPLLRSVGELPVTVELDGRGRVQTLELETPYPANQRSPSREPVTVVLQLSAIGEAASVPMVEATAIE